MSPCRILIVDDSLPFLAAVASLMADLPGIEVIGLASSGREALSIFERFRPDIVLTDLAMPGMSGLELTRHLVEIPPSPPVIIMTIDDQPCYHVAAMAAGASGLLAKADLAFEIQTLIRRLRPDLMGGAGD